IRTGQPGIAPEKTIIDQYDINGYFTKAEATEEKLYSLVKSGVRQYVWAFAAQSAAQMHQGIISSASSRSNILNFLQARADQNFTKSGLFTAMIVDNNIRGVLGWKEEEARAVWQQLKDKDGIPMGTDGDKYVVDGLDHLLHIEAHPSKAECGLLVRSHFDQSDSNVISIYHTVLSSLATIWKRTA
ncbi:MAG: hypothetical protein AAF633_25660, partial [Chloroflexota bacterium]